MGNVLYLSEDFINLSFLSIKIAKSTLKIMEKAMKIVTASAPGKVILFGEHAVVYGIPAIAMSINQRSRCTIERIKKREIQIYLKDFDKLISFSSLNKFISDFPHRFNQLRFCLLNFYNQYKVDFMNHKITISSSLFPSSGLGSSASVSVSIISAINEFYGLGFNREDISERAYEMEKIVHGKPSGIDNTICTFGNAIYFQNKKFRFIEIAKDINILVSYTNIERDTKEAIEEIQELRKKDPKLVNTIFKNIGKIAVSAEKALSKGKIRNIGELMNQNQNYLTSLNVSNQIISKIVNIALMSGAWGSKLTGAGLGGCVLTVGKEKKLRKICSELNEMGFESFLTQMDREGVKIEERK